MAKRSPKLPTVDDVLRHPAFPTAVFNLEPTRKGRVPVGNARGGPFSTAWQIHGSGPVRVVVISGLGGQRTVWQRQTLHFGHERGDRYSVLLVDNRGIGDSDLPLMRYTTSDMAYDLAEVLLHVGWLSSSALPPPATVANPAAMDPPDEPPLPAPLEPKPPGPAGAQDRRLHVVGISLGGMIAQELSALLPHAISSLTLCCTAAQIVNTSTFAENMASRLSLVVPQGLERSVQATARNMFAAAWLAAPDDVRLPDPGDSSVPGVGPPAPAPRVLPAWRRGSVVGGAAERGADDGEQRRAVPSRYARFPTNYHRFVAQELHKRLDAPRFPTTGFLLQLVAAGWHRKTAAELKALGDAVGRERILVMHGTEDGMISPPHGETLIALLQPGVGLIVDGMGHGPVVERWRWFNALLEERFALGERLDGRTKGQ